MQTKGVLVVVSGFSGAGKGTVMKALLEKYDNYALSVSATTRSPRPGEENGREYFFLTESQAGAADPQKSSRPKNRKPGQGREQRKVGNQAFETTVLDEFATESHDRWGSAAILLAT